MSLVEKRFGTGCVPDLADERDLKYEDVVFGAPQIDWNTGFDIEKKLNIKIPFKDQGSSSSCVGNAWAYYSSVLNTVETGVYSDVSAKAIYSQIFLDNGGAYIRDGGSILVDFGALYESLVSSYINGNVPTEDFMRSKEWLDEKTKNLAKTLQSKEYRVIENGNNIEIFARAILENNGVVTGVYGENNGTWNTLEPKPPKKKEWGHALYFGKFGIDERGKYIATPNSWGYRKPDSEHPDGWQRLRENYFEANSFFNPWLLIDKPNEKYMSEELKKITSESEKKIIIEGQGAGRKGVIVNGKMFEIEKTRAAEACLYVLTNNGFGKTVSSEIFNELADFSDNAKF